MLYLVLQRMKVFVYFVLVDVNLITKGSVTLASKCGIGHAECQSKLLSINKMVSLQS